MISPREVWFARIFKEIINHVGCSVSSFDYITLLIVLNIFLYQDNASSILIMVLQNSLIRTLRNDCFHFSCCSIINNYISQLISTSPRSFPLPPKINEIWLCIKIVITLLLIACIWKSFRFLLHDYDFESVFRKLPWKMLQNSVSQLFIMLFIKLQLFGYLWKRMQTIQILKICSFRWTGQVLLVKFHGD